MCGICGVHRVRGDKPISRETVRRMAARLAHRGPDGEGFHFDGRTGLGHRRLKIIDLETGGQPMANEDGSVVIVFNGEIYNYVELREDLRKRGVRFRTASDTEVILRLYELHGEECLGRLRGMFAFAIRDAKRDSLFIARDRIGKKPLYWFEKNGLFFFASEIKALLEAPEYERRVNGTALNYLFAYEWWIPWPHTPFEGIFKMEPATCVTIAGGTVCFRRYWTPPEGLDRRPAAECVEELYGLVEESVKIRLRSDVPLGALLSGGVDSSGIVAFMRDSVPRVKTFTLGFSEGNRVDPEFLRAREIARSFETDHHEVLFTPGDLRLLPQMIRAHDEPYICMTGLYTWFLSRFIREQGVTVVLSGNGPDELLWGYSSGVTLKKRDILRRALGLLPPSAAALLSRSGLGLRLFESPGAKLERSLNETFGAHTAGLLAVRGPSENFGALARRWYDEMEGRDLLTAYSYAATMLTYAYGLTLQVDLAGMAHALEIRSPFLDQRIIELAWRLPPDLKVRGFSTRGCKYILKKALERKLPRELLYAKKLAFGTGIRWEEWLLRTYRREMLALLEGGRWVGEGAWNAAYVRSLFDGPATPAAAMQALRLVAAELWYRMYFHNEGIEELELP